MTSKTGKCEKTGICAFFTNKMDRLADSQERFMFKKEYCIKDKSRCARFIVNSKLYSGWAPPDEETMYEIDSKMRIMFPNDIELANNIISKLCNN
jgi:hypothetical protein